MPDNVMGSYQLPPIDLMSMLLQGPKSYFGQRGAMQNQLYMMNQEQQMRGQYADQLMGSPVFKQAVANPMDPNAQWALWNLSEHGPQSIAQQGASWLQSSLGAQAQRAQTGYENQLALGRMAQQDAYDRGRISFSTDEQLRAEKERINIQNQNFQNMLQSITAPNPATGQSPLSMQQQQDLGYDMLANHFGFQQRPQGMSIGYDGTGNQFFFPTLGSEQWRNAMSELEPIQTQQSAVAQMSDMIDGKTKFDWARMDSLSATVKQSIQQMVASKSMGAGAQERLEQYVPNVPANWSSSKWNPQSNWNLDAREKLRVLQEQMQPAMENWQRKWAIPASRVPNPGYQPAQLPPPPQGSADRAVTQAPASSQAPAELPAGVWRR